MEWASSPMWLACTWPGLSTPHVPLLPSSGAQVVLEWDAQMRSPLPQACSRLFLTWASHSPGCASDFLFSCHIEVQARMSLFDFSRYSPWKVLIPKFKTKSNAPQYVELAQFHRHTMHSSFCIHSPDVNWPPQILTGICCGRPGDIREHHQPNFLPSVEVICGRDVMLWQPCSSHYEFIPVILKLNHSDVIGSHNYETTVFFLLKHHTTQELAIFLFFWH